MRRRLGAVTRLSLALFVPLLVTVVLLRPATAQDDGWRTIEFETTEVTGPDVAVSPDGQWLIFTILGHLFRLPVEGGSAEQFTFGPHYDKDPVFSPDGTRVAFVSDRDGTEGNVFVLEPATGEITQVTHERWAGRPTWSPDGQRIVYLRYMPAGPGPVPAHVRQILLAGGQPETLSTPPRLFTSVFYLADGQLGWAVVEQEPGSSSWTTRIEVVGRQGAVSTVRTLDGYTQRVVPSPAGDGLYCRRSTPGEGRLWPQQTELLFFPLPDGVDRQLFLVSNLPGGRTRWRPHFAVATDNKTLYLGDFGRLWKIGLTSGTQEPIAFRARVRLEIQEPVPPSVVPSAKATSPAPPRSLLSPRLSPDGSSLVFGAAGFLWRQPLAGGFAQRLFEGSAFERDPAFSPDGRQLAFVRSEFGEDEIRVFDFESRRTRTLASGFSYWNPTWSRDGHQLVFVERDDSASPPTSRVVVVSLGEGKKKKLMDVRWWWGSRPHISADGQWLYFSGPPGAGQFYRVALAGEGEPEVLTQVGHLTRAQVSPDGKWLAFQHNMEIRVAPMRSEPVGEEDVRQLSPEGGDTFAFTPDGAALIYAAGNRVWRRPLDGREREEIPIRLVLPRPTPPPLLVRRVRVLDFTAGGFGPETSLLIEQGRISWIGSERGRQLPSETVTLDAGGRFAIPGLFDMHVHTEFRGSNEQAYLAYGVTSVRDTGAGLAWLNALADRSEATADPVPRYTFSGALFEDARPDRPSFHIWVQLRDEDEARTYVHRWKEWGANFIKVHPPISWSLQRAMVDEARRQGLPVVGHGFSLEEITKSVTLGYWSLEHCPFLVHDDVLQLLATAGTRCVPTFPVRGYHDLLLHDEPERLEDAKLQAFTPPWWMRHARTGGYTKSIDPKALRGSFVEDLAIVRAAYRRGVEILVGTDLEWKGTHFFYGSAVHWELEFFVQAGLAPLEVLRIATQKAAEAVGAEDHLGTLEPGKLADLVLLDANPLEDIKNTQTIWRVIKGGWMFDPKELAPPGSTYASQ